MAKSAKSISMGGYKGLDAMIAGKSKTKGAKVIDKMIAGNTKKRKKRKKKK